MARARSERARSKPLAVDDLTQSIEQLQDFVAKVEDLGREGFPYLEGARARTELQFRECIKRAFGDKSPEFQTYRNHKLSSDTKQTASLVRKLIATLEEKKLELQGLKPAIAEEATASEPVRPSHRELAMPARSPRDRPEQPHCRRRRRPPRLQRRPGQCRLRRRVRSGRSALRRAPRSERASRRPATLAAQHGRLNVK